MRSVERSSMVKRMDTVPSPEKTVVNLFEKSCSRFPDNPMFWEKPGEKYESTSYREMQERIYRFAGGLMRMGIKKGDRVAIFSQARKDWIMAELGILYAGAVSVPLSVRLESAELVFRLQHSGARVLVTSAFEYPKIGAYVSELPDLEKIVLLDLQKEYHDHEVFIGDLLNEGAEFLLENEGLFKSGFIALKGDDCALISYTSGTTADPKGIMLSHKNLVTNAEQSLKMFSVEEDFKILLILPLDHSFAHTTGMYVFIASGASLASVKLGRTPASALKNVITNIREVRPDALLSVPTVARNLRKNIESEIRKKGSLIFRLFRLGLKVAYHYNGLGWNRGKGSRIFSGPFYVIADQLLFCAIRKNFGGKLRYFVGGGALLDVELQKFFYAIGMPMYQGYGLTEASPVISSNTVREHKLGSSGKIVPGMDVKICDDHGNEVPAGQSGEIVVRGDNVMLGYYRNVEATHAAIRSGWLFTGDMGYFDGDGYLYVRGRFKSLLIGDDGEKYSPEGIEEFVEETSPMIRQIMLYNNQNPYTTALIYPDAKVLYSRLSNKPRGPADEACCREALGLIRDELDRLKKGNAETSFPQRWVPVTFAVLDEGFTEENHFLNSTLKMVRGKIARNYADRIGSMYLPEGKDIMNALNLEAVRRLLADEG